MAFPLCLFSSRPLPLLTAPFAVVHRPQLTAPGMVMAPTKESRRVSYMNDVRS